MKQIVDKSKTTIGNLYFYFGNKDELLLAVLNQIVAEIWQYADKSLSHMSSGVNKMAMIYFHTVTLLLDHEDVARLMMVGNGIPSVRNAIYREFHERGRRLAEEDPQVLRGSDVELNFFMAQGAAFSLVQRRLDDELTSSTHDVGVCFARWCMLALGYPPQFVNKALEAIETTLKTGAK
jgi:AcrR family transcriptional regulator